jgi:hypothetical protein
MKKYKIEKEYLAENYEEAEERFSQDVWNDNYEIKEVKK